MTYIAPLDHMKFVIDHLCDYDAISGFPANEDASKETAHAVLDEAGKFAAQSLSSINRHGDLTGSTWSEGSVTTSPEWQTAYNGLVENGWNSPSADQAFGGMDLPNVVNACIQEMLHGANMAFQLCPMLTQGAIEALHHYGSETQKQIFLPKLVTGEWSGTMNLTEPQAGSDLSGIRTSAEPKEDHFLIRGQKIYITYGDHDLTENIIHLVLARLPDSPSGVKGISLFVVPKVLVNDDSSLGETNDVKCVSIEHKLGIHGSPTCTMAFGENAGAVGYLVGEESRGLEYMFAMMNSARLSVGIQGIGVSEHAYQDALAYAKDRNQGGRAIVDHPDVSQTLGRMRSMTEAGRILAYRAAASQDIAKCTASEEVRDFHNRRVGLLIPIIKGFWCEQSIQTASAGVQVHGGMGFVEETGAAQHYRDAKITTIYEGTTGIQALDLVGRKILKDKGRAAFELLAEMSTTARALKFSEDRLLRASADHLAEFVETLAETLKICFAAPSRSKDRAGTVLPLFGYACAVWCQLDAAQAVTSNDGGEVFRQAILSSALIAVTEFLPLARAAAETIAATVVEVEA
jgi:alkylation response protein AidB-like acyl-CoA dehydrogenase